MKNYLLTEEQRDSIAAMYSAGFTPLSIAKEFGITTGYVQNVRNKYGLEAQNKELSEFAKMANARRKSKTISDEKPVLNNQDAKRKMHLSEEQQELAMKLYAEGIGANKIGNLFGVSGSHIGNIRRKLGIPPHHEEISSRLETWHKTKRDAAQEQICFAKEESETEIQDDEIVCVIDKEKAIVKFLEGVSSQLDFLLKVLKDEIN